jgi:hypothetical protein
MERTLQQCRSAAELLTRDEARRRIAANVAKVLELVRNSKPGKNVFNEDSAFAPSSMDAAGF